MIWLMLMPFIILFKVVFTLLIWVEDIVMYRPKRFRLWNRRSYFRLKFGTERQIWRSWSY